MRRPALPEAASVARPAAGSRPRPGPSSTRSRQHVPAGPEGTRQRGRAPDAPPAMLAPDDGSGEARGYARLVVRVGVNLQTAKTSASSHSSRHAPARARDRPAATRGGALRRRPLPGSARQARARRARPGGVARLDAAWLSPHGQLAERRGARSPRGRASRAVRRTSSSRVGAAGCPRSPSDPPPRDEGLTAWTIAGAPNEGWARAVSAGPTSSVSGTAARPPSGSTSPIRRPRGERHVKKLRRALQP